MSDWEFVKDRTATQGAVWRSTDGHLYKRTGGEDLRKEVEFQRLATDLGYPVAEIVDSGMEKGSYYVIEGSLGTASLHDEAVADARRNGAIGDEVISTAANVASRLLRAQAAHPLPATPWFEKAAFAANAFEENPDLDTPRVHEAVKQALDRTAALPLVHGHLDYGLPNVLAKGVIDWQHHGPVPLGYDVYPALDIVAFKGADGRPDRRSPARQLKAPGWGAHQGVLPGGALPAWVPALPGCVKQGVIKGVLCSSSSSESCRRPAKRTSIVCRSTQHTSHASTLTSGPASICRPVTGSTSVSRTVNSHRWSPVSAHARS